MELYNPTARSALHLGFLTFDRANTEHEVRWDEKNGSGISSYCDFEGFQLPAGNSVASATLVLQAGSDPYRNLQVWANLVQNRYQPRIWPKIPAGWVGWSWVDPFHSERYEDVVRRNARAVRERLPGLDIGFVWVSIGNLARHEPGNWLGWNYELFPAGPQALVQDLAGLDFRLG